MSNGAATTAGQYALIAFLAKRFGGPRLGKKALQKSVHLLQELGGVDAGYRFSFYTYGPYSSTLAGDLDIVAMRGGAKVSYNATDNYYAIEATPETEGVIARGQEFIDRHRTRIDRVLDRFGGRTAKDLELVSTIVYLRRHAPAGIFDDDAKLIERVRNLKPKYSDAEITTAIREVREFLTTDRRAA